ncbi:MAG: hypothetical protein IPH12_09060 [Saprospirales bacterium]|nr:hypothetical protein [Saprospirales bacterium]MBK8920984.1 hypothetical protein [Saprospirales bacterium]
MRRSIFLSACCLLAAAVAAQSPWARSKAGAYTQLGYHTIPAYTALFGKDGPDIDMIREVSEHTVQFYGEYGLTNRSTVVLSMPYRFTRRGARNPDSPYMFAVEDTGSVSGLGNVSLALRHQFTTGRLAVGGTLRLDFPSDKSNFSAGLRTGFNAFTVQPSISAGMGFARAYWFAYGGYAIRTNHYSHFINAGLEGGVHLGPVWLIGFSEWVGPLRNGSRSLPALDVLTGLYVNDQGWISIGLKGIWEINRFVGVVVSGAGAAAARYVPKSPGLSAAVYFKWD